LRCAEPVGPSLDQFPNRHVGVASGVEATGPFAKQIAHVNSVCAASVFQRGENPSNRFTPRTMSNHEPHIAPSLETILARTPGVFYRQAAAIEQLAAEGFCQVMDVAVRPPPARYVCTLIGFPDYRLTVQRCWFLPLRFTVQYRTSNIDTPWRENRLFTTSNLHGLLACLFRSRFEKLAPVHAPHVPFARRNPPRHTVRWY
jgi:hypothetical protein